VKTYAAQEPCFISQLPQILNGFEYKGCLFRVHWAPWGDLPAFNHDSFLWEGPDGAHVVAIPRYSFDERTLFGYGPWDVKKAAQAGIRRPLASRFDDFETKRISPALDGHNQTSPWAALAQEIQAGQYQGKTLSFSGWIRSSAPAACLMLDFGDPAYMFVEAFVANDGAWHRVELKFNVPLHARFLYPEVRVYGSAGDAAFDGLSLVATGDSRELLQNGSFETGDKAPANWGIWRQDGTDVETSWLAAGPGLPGRAVGLRFQGQSASFIPVTLGEFISTLGRPEVVIHDPTSQAEQRWAWGILGGELERKCRRAQRLTEAAERAACLYDTNLEQNVSDAWRLVLMANHHDTLCCFPMQFGYWSWSKEETYADLCREWTSDAESRANVILRSALGVSSSNGSTVTVFNPIPQSRSLVLIHGANPANGLSLAVRRAGQTSEEIRSESVVLATDSSGKPTKAMVAWPTELPPLSSETFQLAEAQAGNPPGRLEPCQSTVLENEFYRVSITSDSGIVSLFDKRLGCELLGSPAHFAAFFPDDQANARSSVSELRAYQGQLLGLAEMRGRMGAIPFEQRVLLKTGSHAVEIEVEFDFGASCRIGAATDNVFPKTNVSSDFADETQKLRFVFPSAISLSTALSDNSYDVVTASKSSSWAVSWAAAEGPVGGIGLLLDRSSAFLWNSSTLELVLAYGNRFMIGPESGIPLSGRHRYTFALTSYGPNWEAARLPELAADFDRPVVQIDGKAERSPFLPIGVDGHVITGAMYREDNVLYMRLFNPYTTQQTALIKGLAGNIVSEANLQGAVIRRITPSEGQCTIAVPAKRLVTLRIENEQ
ncbi:MAG: hypothetical protein NTZ09_08975, partial [Candidatus Hydrogenedentes bacterium]|nr:hypothetical protein [Candidatus Hydrogenedentota bacterium]